MSHDGKALHCLATMTVFVVTRLGPANGRWSSSIRWRPGAPAPPPIEVGPWHLEGASAPADEPSPATVEKEAPPPSWRGVIAELAR
jgi:hypothetical protein